MNILRTLKTVVIGVGVALAMLATTTLAIQQRDPQPPCGMTAYPPFPGVDETPIVRFWDRTATSGNWNPPQCTGWTTRGFGTLTVIVGRFRNPLEVDGMRRRIGEISGLKGLRYWSITHKEWQTLIVDAFATSIPPRQERRRDFSTDEIVQGASLYFEQTDNLSGKAIYRLRILDASSSRLVFETENLTTMRYLLVPLFHPGDAQAVYFLDRESDGVWRYYSIVRTGKNASGLTAGHEASSINRAVAFYRFIAGIPPDLEPPAAR